MSIQITITDPAHTSPAELELVQSMIAYFINPENNRYGSAVPVAALAPMPPLAAADNPGAGVEYPSAEQSQQLAENDPNIVFNPQASTALALVGGPNGGPSTASSGVPLAPNNGGATGGGATPVDRDRDGFPWDNRIHAKSSTGPGGVKNADGTWRGKRGVDPAYVNQIKGELAQAMGAPAPAPAAATVIPLIPAAGAPALPNGGLTSSDASPTAQAGGGMPATVTIGSVVPVQTPATGSTFVTLAGKVGALFTAQKLNNEDLAAVCASIGLANLQLLAHRPDLVPQAEQMIDGIVAMKG